MPKIIYGDIKNWPSVTKMAGDAVPGGTTKMEEQNQPHMENGGGR